ncbi:hypothetical protein D9611_003412 [Ephemerocybe angulata]|uniref:Dihydroorotate oxidase n=1 Tax=Ephemerocybe angulata TaxID=980116 RepID=A0A8H5FHJ8_9AGAR|nr:hypothetical protein D9611_003412 [Tulosesus angulatus]
MATLHSIQISPPLLNSSCAWSSNLRDLQELYDSPFTGAITTRTATIAGFNQDESHTVVFSNSSLSALNSYGYSPHPLSEYLGWVKQILQGSTSDKPVIISITSPNADGLESMVSSIQELRRELGDLERTPSRIAIELNTSCPNIRHASPSGYSFVHLLPLLKTLSTAFEADQTLTIGLKLPPYVYREQFVDALQVLSGIMVSSRSPISFFACTNTLGSSLLFPEQVVAAQSADSQFAVPSATGGLSGESVHALALGNVYTFTQLLRGPEARFPSLSKIKIIGVGGVTSKEAMERMRKAGAGAVACATFYGKEGVRAFELLSS